MRRSRLLLVFVLSLSLLTLGLPSSAQTADETAASEAPMAGGYTIVKYPQGQPACTGVGLRNSLYYDRIDCGFGYAAISDTDDDSEVVFGFSGPDGTQFATQEATRRSGGEWQFNIRPNGDWPSGDITVDAFVDGSDTSAGSTTIFHNKLGASVGPVEDRPYAPGEEIALTGRIYELDSVGLETQERDVAGTTSLQVSLPSGEVRGPYGPVTANSNGDFTFTLPPDATAGLNPTIEDDFQLVVGIEAVDASYNDPVTGPWAAQEAGRGAATVARTPDQLLLENDFTSSVGWVKPGEGYPFRLIVRNVTGKPASGVRVTVPPVDGTTFTGATPVGGAGTASVGQDGVTWDLGSLAAGTPDEPSIATLVVLAEADTLSEDPQAPWKNLSSTATITYDGGPAQALSVTSHGPKVIPPSSTYETARYGDRPFPVVPVDYRDRKHAEDNPGSKVAGIINSPDFEGSTFNLFQEMSYGQLFPNGTVPSASIAQADFDPDKDYGFTTFSTPPPNTCQGYTVSDGGAGSPLLPDRIVDGWYQLPGDTGYYGSDSGGTAIQPVASQIDAGCGDTGKSVYDAAAIADPEIDYNDFDTDKDGVVDFFMMIFVGVGGNGVSQTSVPPYDNIWPHSSTLESGFVDEETGLAGYVSDDQLKDLEGRPLYFTDEGRTEMTTEKTDFPVPVRVGPYNVNPESALEAASVISHEYGHSLGLPDYYSGSGVTGGTEFYDTWNLMATDYSQSMDVQARQELGWVIPRDVPEGTTTASMVDKSVDTHRIDWQTIDGEPYTLEGPSVHNGDGYAAKLPREILIDPALVENGASPTHVFWSQSGNDFACPPDPAAHSLDIDLSVLGSVEPGTPITLEYSSFWDIEWDFDYGFTMITTDGGENYTALESEEGYTTDRSQNPNTSQCQARYGNGLTGTSGSYQGNGVSPEVDRALGDQVPGDAFLTDRYDLSEFAGVDTAFLRFAYHTDVGVARPGWFIDDIVVKAGDEVIYSTNLEEEEGGAENPTIYNGGCQEDLSSSTTCDRGWQYVSSEDGAPSDHSYYFELRDRTGFDLDSNGQSDRGDITFLPGLSLAFTNEAEGYGNSTREDRPNQHILDAVPDPGDTSPNLDDAAFNAGETYSDFGEGHVDNYEDPEQEDGLFRFAYDCLELEVLEMAGDELGPETPPGDLTAEVEMTRGDGCVEFDYGYEGVTAEIPTGPQVPDEPGDPGDPGGPTDPNAPGGDTVDRIGGEGRIQTAIALSKSAFASADSVVLARADMFPDALSAAALASEIDGPVLLNPVDELNDEVAAELERLGAETVYLAGGVEAQDASVEEALAADYEVVRLGGANRFGTAAELAREVVEIGGPVQRALVARADDFPDALASSNIAAAGRAPILLSTTGDVPAETQQVLDELLDNGETVYIAGGPAAVGVQSEATLNAAGYDTQRRFGAERYATAVAIAEEAVALGADRQPVMLASGLDFPDALAAGPVAAKLGGMLLLVDRSDLAASQPTADYLQEHRAEIDTVFVAGGPAAIEKAVLGQVQEAIKDE